MLNKYGQMDVPSYEGESGAPEESFVANLPGLRDLVESDDYAVEPTIVQCDTDSTFVLGYAGDVALASMIRTDTKLL